MPQDKRIMAYRSRLWRRGYKRVSVTLVRGDRYLVIAVEPLAGLYVRKSLRIDEMENEMKGVKA